MRGCRLLIRVGGKVLDIVKNNQRDADFGIKIPVSDILIIGIVNEFEHHSLFIDTRKGSEPPAGILGVKDACFERFFKIDTGDKGRDGSVDALVFIEEILAEQRVIGDQLTVFTADRNGCFEHFDRLLRRIEAILHCRLRHVTYIIAESQHRGKDDRDGDQRHPQLDESDERMIDHGDARHRDHQHREKEECGNHRPDMFFHKTPSVYFIQMYSLVK